jgi:hypothetical protein
MGRCTIYLFITLLFYSNQTAFCLVSSSEKQIIVSIPAAGNSWIINDVMRSDEVITATGITNWSNTESTIRTYFRIEKPGELKVSLRLRIKSGVSEIEVSSNRKSEKISISNQSFDTIYTGTFNFETPGYQWIDLKGLTKTSTAFAEVTDIILSGGPAEGKVYYVKDDFYFGRRGPSVHLKYNLPAEASDIEWFYNELTIPEGNDVLGSYYMANGFTDGYFGIQCNSPEERRILFSVWSPYKTDNPGAIPEEYKIIMLKKGKDVITQEFGNEGSGGQSYRKFFWKTGNTYRFLLKGNPSVNNSTDYTAYFYAPEIGKWELIASFRRPKTNNYLNNLYSFLENFLPETGPLTRKGLYSNQWICNKKGTWNELSEIKFTADATARNEARLDYSGGVENGVFFLRNCGFFSDKANIDQIFSRPKTGNPPVINFAELE